MSDDRYEEEDLSPAHQALYRPRGRAEPEAPRARLVDIVVDGVLLGSLDPNTLTANAQFELEEASQATELLDWLARYAGANRSDVRKVIGDMPLTSLMEIGRSIGTALGEAIKVPKPKRRP